jgi:hypothetical protein
VNVLFAESDAKGSKGIRVRVGKLGRKQFGTWPVFHDEACNFHQTAINRPKLKPKKGNAVSTRERRWN